MAFGDLVIARNKQELEMFQRSDVALRALSGIESGVRASAAIAAATGMHIAASLDALQQVERENTSLLGDINLGLAVVSDQLSQGFAEVVYEQRLQSETLKGILESVTNPNAVQAREFRERGFYAYSNGWLDEAKTELNSATEKNPFDFTVHQVLGDIASKKPESLSLAAEEFLKAAKYAAPVSGADSAYALMCAAKALRMNGRAAESLAPARQATGLLPDLAEAHFVLAQSAVAAGQAEDARAALLQSLTLKPELSVLAAEDATLSADSPMVESVLTQVRNSLAESVGPEWALVRTRFERFIKAADRVREAWNANETDVARGAGQKPAWSLFRKVDESPAAWNLSPRLGDVGVELKSSIVSMDGLLERRTILDLALAQDALRRDAHRLTESAVGTLRVQREAMSVPGAVAVAILDAIVAIDPHATRVAPCPQCGKTVAEWDDYCHSCGVLYKERLQVPPVLATAYDDWLRNDRYWPTFLAQLSANALSLPHGPGAANRVAARFPKAAGRAGFNEIVSRLED